MSLNPAPLDLAPVHLPRAVFACLPQGRAGERRHPEPDSPLRSVFQRDRDRVIHALAFRRLMAKTQVFVFDEGDHYRTRLTHSLEVAQITRARARSFMVDEDLAEAIALAHDLGHTPFGHAGERALAACMAGAGGFDHNVQSLRVVVKLERRYARFDGLNLSHAALEGLIKHNGPVPAERRAAMQQQLDGWPMDLATRAPLEGQFAAIADDIAYTNHDLDDGLRAELFTIEEVEALELAREAFAAAKRDLPQLDGHRLRQEGVRRLINRMVMALVEESQRRLHSEGIRTADDLRHAPRQIAAFPDDMLDAYHALRAFLRRRMYQHYKVNRMARRAETVVRGLFDVFLAAPECLPEAWRQRAERASDDAARKRVIADYIAGMTDRYAVREYRQLFRLSRDDEHLF